MNQKLDTGAMRHMTVPFEFKAASAAEGYAGEFTGYAAGILNVDHTGDMILPGAFTATLPEFLKDGVVCWQHDWATPIGKPMEAREDGYGLLTRSRISDTSTGRDCMTLIRDGVIKKLSIGYRVQDYEWVDRRGLLGWLAGSGLDESKQIQILTEFDGEGLSELFLLKQIQLFEYSPVTIPANSNATITAAKGLPFAKHSEAVVTAVRELSERIKAIHALRTAQGKAANASHVEHCREIQAMLDGASRSLLTLMAEMEPEPEEVEEDSMPKNNEAKRLRAEFIIREAQRRIAA